MLSITDLIKIYRTGTRALNGVTFKIDQPQDAPARLPQLGARKAGDIEIVQYHLAGCGFDEAVDAAYQCTFTGT